LIRARLSISTGTQCWETSLTGTFLNTVSLY